MTPFQTLALSNLPSLTPTQKMNLITSIAKKMTATILAISREIKNDNLDAENTAPMQNFIKTIQMQERRELRRVERRVAKYRLRERERRVERREIRREFGVVMRRIRELRGVLEERVCGEGVERGMRRRSL